MKPRHPEKINKPINPNTKDAAIKFGIIPINDNFIDLNKIINITKIPIITIPKVFI